MEEKEFNEKMNSLKKPGFRNIDPDKKLKLLIVNSRKSAVMGIWFLAVPCYFLVMVLMKYYYNVNLHIINIFEDFVSSLEKSPATKFITPLFFVILPAAGIVINLLSIMFFDYNKEEKQLNISIRFKPLNLIVAIFCFLVVSIFLVYLVTENLHHI